MVGKEINDLISRQAALDALSHMMDIDGFRDGYAVSRANVDSMLRSLPPAQPERIRGKWEYVDYGGFGNYHCTACRSICICNGDYDLCPNCGADMRGEQNETN